jgi:hypothetical protein
MLIGGDEGVSQLGNQGRKPRVGQRRSRKVHLPHERRELAVGARDGQVRVPLHFITPLAPSEPLRISTSSAPHCVTNPPTPRGLSETRRPRQASTGLLPTGGYIALQNRPAPDWAGEKPAGGGDLPSESVARCADEATADKSPRLPPASESGGYRVGPSELDADSRRTWAHRGCCIASRTDPLRSPGSGSAASGAGTLQWHTGVESGTRGAGHWVELVSPP